MERAQSQGSRRIPVPKQEPSPFLGNSISTCRYNAVTFLPKNLWYQFQRLANVYFLVIAVLQVIPEISVSGGIPNILPPLIFVLGVSAVKDALEDLKRKKSDREENNRKTKVWKNNAWEQVKWQNVEVGDLVKISQDEYFPADILLLVSSFPKGICYVETKNLDGETNLKQKVALHRFMSELSEENPGNLQAEVECELPNSLIYDFRGVIQAYGDRFPVSSEQLLLRGSSLKNTYWVLGVVVYTGHETKIMLNSTSSKGKFSWLEEQMNKQIVYIFILQCILCFFCGLVYSVWFLLTEADTEQYLELDEAQEQIVVVFILNFFSWMLIFTNFVPISLIVTLEIVKFFQAVFIAWDKEIYHEETDTPTKVQASNLNEELGQIHYVFSDKTGTVTCNIMEFRKFSLKGVAYGTDRRMEPTEKVQNVDFCDSGFDASTEEARDFLMHLASCHTIITEESSEGVKYNASSPDELALVSGAKYFGVELLGRDEEQGVILNLQGEQVTVKILNVLEFTSARKRMSVVAQYPNGKIMLLCKGADSVLLPRINESQVVEESWHQLESFASEGLRTLVIAGKEIDPQYYVEWNRKFSEAQGDIQNRETRVEKVAEEIEHSMDLLGVTAIEDKLQERVPETIAALKEAGCKVWLLTGDKIETAINIGYSCALLSNEMGRAVIEANYINGVKYQLHEAFIFVNSEQYSKFALVVSGDSLVQITTSNLMGKFVQLLDKVEVVLACRVSPQQKSDIVNLVKETKKEVRTLAIGDGANDVNMINSAHVGVGIAGLEGNQAARASDYSIGQFRFLQRLMFVHGEESYRRNANLICYNFYKNVLLVMPLFFYGIFSAFSGQILYNMWTYNFFNVSFAFFPIFFYAIFDRVIEYSKLEKTPRLYRLGQDNLLFKTEIFWKWIIEATLQAFAIAVVIVISICYYSGDSEYGRNFGMWVASDLILGIVVIVSNLKILCFSYILFWFSILVNILSILTYFGASALITMVLPISETLDNFDGRGSTYMMLVNPNSYSAAVLLVVACFLFYPIKQHIEELVGLLKSKSKYEEPEEEQLLEEESIPLSEYTSLLTRRHTGFAFSGESRT